MHLEPESDRDGQAIERHRLTDENIRKMLAVDRVVLPLLLDQPDLFASGDEGIDAAAATLERIPEVYSALKDENFTAREFVLTACAALWAARIDELLLSGEITIAPRGTAAENMKVLKSLPPDLQSEVIAWKAAHST